MTYERDQIAHSKHGFKIRVLNDWKSCLQGVVIHENGVEDTIPLTFPKSEFMEVEE
jgi:hypothetical protein